MLEPPDKKLILYLILVTIVFLITCFLIGCVLSFLSIKPEPEISLNDCFISAPNIPYVPTTYVLGTLVNEELYNIIKCESGFNSNAKNPNSSAKGLGQIIDSTLRRCEVALGRELNAYNVKDNLDCCKYLYKINGTADWLESKSCWQRSLKTNK